MEITKEYTLDMLTDSSVSILTRQFIVIDGEKQQLGENHRKAYENNEDGIAQIKEEIPEPYKSSVFNIWGYTETE